MKHIAVIGLGFGDEGKGRVVDWLCSQEPNPTEDVLVIRFSGGPQAAHRVVLPNGVEHIFSSFGSGSLRGVPTLLTEKVLVNPIAILNEYDILERKCETKPKLYAVRECPIITPYDMAWNRQSKERNNGTCGAGIFATVRRERAGCHFWLEDLFSSEIVRKFKIEQVARFYHKLKMLPKYTQSFLDACTEMIDRKILNCIYPPTRLIHGTRIYEGSQGLLLDQNYGFYPYVTPSNTGIQNLKYIARLREVYLVTRAYQTRHGNGPMSPIVENKIKDDINEKNVENEYQGSFRKTILDLDLLKYAANKDLQIKQASKKLFVTCTDHVEKEYRMFADGKIFNAHDEGHFLTKIHNTLGTLHVYSSCGPTASDVDKRI